MNWQLLTLIEIIWVALVSVWIVLEKRSPTATLAWIFGLAFLPVIGVIIYVLLGPRRLRRKRLRRRRAVLAVGDRASTFFARAPEPERRRLAQTMRLAQHRDGFPAVTARSVEIYSDNARTYRAIEEAIASAKHHVHVEYFIFEPDQTGSRLLGVMTEAARRGIEVRLLVDAIGSPRLTRRAKLVRAFVAAGGQFARFNVPLVGGLLGQARINFRTHRKIVVVDGHTGFTGGLNVEDRQNPEVLGEQAWRDTHMKMTGLAVRGLQRTFLEDWHFVTGSAPASEVYFPEQEPGQHPIQIVASGPDHDWFAIGKVYFHVITQARSRVWLTTPYFVPDEALLVALVTAAQRGVDVRVLVPQSTDSRWVDAAGRSYFDVLCEHGVKIRWKPRPMVHAKTLVIDDDLAIVGTANFDNRSLRLNFEVIALAYDPGLNARLAEIFDEHSLGAERLGDHDCKAPAPTTLFEAMARLLSPQL